MMPGRLRRAAYCLFMDGFSPKTIGELLNMRGIDVEDMVREHSRAHPSRPRADVVRALRRELARGKR